MDVSLLENNILLACFVPLGILSILKRNGSRDSWFIPLILIAFPIIRGMLAPFQGAIFQHGRYVANLVPLITLTGLLGLQMAGDYLRLNGGNGRFGRWANAGIWTIIVVNLLVMDVKYAEIYGSNVENINNMHVRAGEWLGANTPKNAVIASHDIGAIGYFSGRRVLDTSGLISPDVLAYLQSGQPADQGVLDYLTKEKPEYLVILPTWYPQLAKKSDLFYPIQEFTLNVNTVAAGSRLVVFRTAWAEE